MEDIFLYTSRYFHRFYLMYGGGFPLNQYKLMVVDNMENEYGAQIFGYIFRYIEGERTGVQEHLIKPEYGMIAHEIAHAWSPGSIFNGMNGKDGWYVEGLTVFNEYLAISNDRVVPSIGLRFATAEENLMDAVEAMKEHENNHIPLSTVREYIRPGSIYTLQYNKGALVTYLIYRKLLDNGYDYYDYLAYVYQKYYLDHINTIDPGHLRFISAEEMYSNTMQESLENFSGLDFDDIFDAYVFGDDPTIDQLVVTLDEIIWQY